ncbi:MAG: caspase family protein [Paracoccaceae bacterium]
MFRMVLFVLCGLFFAATHASAAERFALVIGNDTYETISPLTNSVGNAERIAAQLESLGFDVTLITDANLVDMRRSVGRYNKRMQYTGNGATGLVFFAGHGVNAFGTNYLLPVDVSIKDAGDLEFVAVDITSIIRTSGADDQIQNLIILDCCAKTPYTGMQNINGGGLSSMLIPNENYIAYSAPENGTAPEGEIFASAFIEAIAVPGQSIEAALDQVNNVIVGEYGDAQTIFRASSLEEPFVFVNAAVEKEVPDETPVPVPAPAPAPVVRETPLPVIEEAAPSDANSEAVELPIISGTTLPVIGETPAPTETLEQTQLPVIGEAPQPALNSTTLPVIGETPLPAIVEAPLPVIAETAPPVDVVEETLVPANNTVSYSVSYTEPLTLGSPEVIGKSIEQLIETKPMFSPIEGLPESYWKEQECGECHKWTQATLCDEGEFYLKQDNEDFLDQQHPFGGSFKQNLLIWAKDGCP